MVRPIDSAVRTVHLVMGTFVLLFLLLYALSGVQMAFAPISWTVVGEYQVPVTPGAVASPRALARHVMQDRRLEGEIKAPAAGPEGLAVTIAWPGTEYQVSWPSGAETALVRTRVVGLVGVMNRLHQLAGLWHEHRLLNLWGLWVALTSAALFGLGITGIWLWFRMHEERVVGAVLLAAGSGVGLLLAWAIRSQA